MDSLELIKEKFGAKILSSGEKTRGKIYIELAPEDIEAAAAYLYNDLDFRYIVVTGVDHRYHIELLYHFAEDSAGKVYSLRTKLTDKKNPSIKSLTHVIKGIHWIEREIHEMLGVDFPGNTNLKHLLLPEDWPEGKYPYRQEQNRDQEKDFEKK